MEKISIEIDVRTISKTSLKKMVEQHISDDVRFEFSGGLPGNRGIDPTILVAIVSASAAGISALIAGIMNVREQAKAQRVVMIDQDGRRLEVPSDMTTEQVEFFAATLADLSVQKITLEK